MSILHLLVSTRAACRVWIAEDRLVQMLDTMQCNPSLQLTKTIGRISISQQLMAMGIANVLADGMSMGFGGAFCVISFPFASTLAV